MSDQSRRNSWRGYANDWTIGQTVTIIGCGLIGMGVESKRMRGGQGGTESGEQPHMIGPELRDREEDLGYRYAKLLHSSPHPAHVAVIHNLAGSTPKRPAMALDRVIENSTSMGGIAYVPHQYRECRWKMENNLPPTPFFCPVLSLTPHPPPPPPPLCARGRKLSVSSFTLQMVREKEFNLMVAFQAS